LNNTAVEFGKRLRSKRKSLGISQEKLALLAEIDRSYVGRIERGEVSVTIERVYELAAA
jgi:transcriptional regulator with XRE-family HTH domain